ncbi:MAG: prolyl oligopeptidase family serine peptidase [Gemmatimonadales bacterium]
MHRVPRVVSILAVLSVSVPVIARAQNGDPSITPDVVYGHKDGMALTFDVYRPAGSGNGAGVLFMVSGGWVSHWFAPERSLPRYKALLDDGFTVFAVRHGSSPRYKVPDAVADVRQALHYIALHAGEFGVDAARLGVYGGSAGGHLSLMLGLAWDSGVGDAADQAPGEPAHVAAVVAYYPPVDLRPLVGPSERFPALEFADSLAPAISPILFVTPDDPPTLLIHGDADDLVPIRNSELMYKALQDSGVESKFIVIPGAGHGFRRAEDRARARAAMVAWFERYLGAEHRH